jgi:predicted MFS family arabinose efflux permease
MATFTPRYRSYVLGLLLVAYVLNSFDRSILSILLEPIKTEFALADVQLGLLGGLAFAAFYSTLGIPVALLADRWNRRNVLALSVLIWSAATVLCGFAASFFLLVLARIGTAIGEAGGNPTSQSLISTFFTPERRATVLGIFALGAPAGTILAGVLGGLGSDTVGWRMTFMLAGLPGIVIGPLIFFTLIDPRASAPVHTHAPAVSFREVIAFLWQRPSFRHLCLACALHSIAIYGVITFNAPFLSRSHGWTGTDIGRLMALNGVFGIAGTFLGGFLADRLNARHHEQRWSAWVCALASLVLPPVQLVCYLSDRPASMVAAFCASGLLSTVFFGPAFAMTQALAADRMRATAASVLIFVKTMIGLGLGPLLIGAMSDALTAQAGRHSLRYALLIAAACNLWSAAHFLLAARTLRSDVRRASADQISAATHCASPSAAASNPGN